MSLRFKNRSPEETDLFGVVRVACRVSTPFRSIYTCWIWLVCRRCRRFVNERINSVAECDWQAATRAR